MSEEYNQNGQAPENGSLKQEWKGVGKGLGETFSGLGNSLVRTAKVGLNAADDWASGNENTNREEEKQAMKDGWKDFGHSFVDTAEDFGKASVKSVKRGVDSVDDVTDSPKPSENTSSNYAESNSSENNGSSSL